MYEHRNVFQSFISGYTSLRLSNVQLTQPKGDKKKKIILNSNI